MEEIKENTFCKKFSCLNVWWLKSLVVFIVLLGIFCAGVSFGERHGGFRMMHNERGNMLVPGQQGKAGLGGCGGCAQMRNNKDQVSDGANKQLNTNSDTAANNAPVQNEIVNPIQNPDQINPVTK